MPPLITSKFMQKNPLTNQWNILETLKNNILEKRGLENLNAINPFLDRTHENGTGGT